MNSVRAITAALALAGAVMGSVYAAVAPSEPSRFDPLVIHDPVTQAGIRAETPAQLPDFDEERAAWSAFRERHGGGWKVYLDRRSGVPTLVEGQGVSWAPPDGPISLNDLAAKAREFVSENALLFKIDETQLILNAEGSGPADEDHWVLVFDRQVEGVPVEGERVVLYVTRGNLVAFGAGRWGHVGRLPDATLTSDAARAELRRYMGLEPHEWVEDLEAPRLVLVAAPPASEGAGPYVGPVGEGIRHRLAWRFALGVEGERGIWVGKVDAATGEVIALYDDVRYASAAKGGVYPISNDGDCPTGCEQLDYPMPWADLDVDGSPDEANDMGLYECSPVGATVTTTLNGPYVRISDNCGSVSESTTCDDDLDLRTSGGDDCTVPSGSSSGNTHSSRACFYHLNRVKEKSRAFLPANTWLTQKLTSNVNINSQCNAYWNGSVNFYRSGGGCGNTGEIAGVINHEYGHGIDQNDGGGYDNPSEGYADVVAIISDRSSCVGRGFYADGRKCTGYGDTCLTCTGIREMDWDARQAHTPATPANFTQPNCGGGGGPCGRAVHCESYVPSESIYDLATRDLPAWGMDTDTAWQHAEKLFYASRQGSGGAAFNCSLPNSDGCNADSWFTKLRNIDDDDGDLNNGTPHASAIFAAFDRHAIACGLASDPSNQDSSSCPALDAPELTGTAGSNSAGLSWTGAAGAAEYTVLRGEMGCDATFNIIDSVPDPTTDYTDTDLPNDFEVFYRIQAQGSNSACESALSNCASVTPQPFAGSVKLDRATYGCSTVITITVRDANIGSSTTTTDVFSTTEPDPETVILTETAPGSARYVGTISTTPGGAAPDGLLSLSHGDTITAQYIDADDGEGGSGLLRETTASADCVYPVISGVSEDEVTDVRAVVSWTTDEASTSVVRWGVTTPPGGETSDSALVTSHEIPLTGLQECTVYYYSVESEDPSGNVALDDNGGQYFHFETLGDFGEGLQPCHAGVVSLDKSVISCNSAFEVRLVDIDLNLSATEIDTAVVDVTSSTEAIPEILTLTETGPSTSTFTGSIATGSGEPVAGDGILQASDGDFLTATYHDEDDGTGSPAISFATGDADCAGADATTITIQSLTDESAEVRVITSEPTTVTVDWGESASLGKQVVDNNTATAHTLGLAPIEECDRLYFRVTTTDRYGNVSVFDASGSPFEFNAHEIPGAVFKDGFETPGAWTLEGEWEIGAPQGLGSSPGDPSSAFSGTNVLGHDLSGQGTYSGDYEPQTSERAISPVIDASTLANGELKFRRRLNTDFNGIASIEVMQSGTWVAVWTGTNLGQTETTWSLQRVDVSEYADANGSLQIAFRQRGGLANNHDAGWNVDRFIVRDGSQPDFAACGSCGGAPTFEGVASAGDVDPCADTGIALSWTGAPAWGTGATGTYAIYRDTDAGFVPSGSNLVASGVAGTSWTDPNPPNDVTLYYIVRAENDETCSTGPNNGGLMDGNLVRASARDETSQPAPGDVGESLRVNPVNEAHVRLTWEASATAAAYHVYRSASPNGVFDRIGEVAGTFFDDRDQMGDSADAYYRVRAADSCGNEGP